MPKVLIREIDGSTTGIPASDNFAVVVPGYFGANAPTVTKPDGTIEYLADTKLWNSDGVYELKSRTDFESYIGKYVGTERKVIVPVLEVINTAADANDYTKYVWKITASDFDRYLNPDNAEYIYKAEVTTAADEVGKNGHLLKTFTYVEKVKKQATDPDTGELLFEDEDKTIPIYEVKPGTTDFVYVDGETVTVTVKFTKINSLAEIIWSNEGLTNPVSYHSNYCIIKRGNEGTDAIQEPHIGNQIAYELLGLGYTVLYKKLDNNDQLTQSSFWEPLKDKSIFNFRYVMTGGYYNAAAMDRICELAAFNNKANLEDAETYGRLAGRGDCIALCDLDENISGYEITPNCTMGELVTNIGQAAKLIKSNEYSALFAPRVTYAMTADEKFGNNKTFPASFHYLACAARTFNRYNEWYAVAGYNRGISNYSIETTSVKLGEIAINTLAPRKLNDYTTKSVNLILHERGNYYLWGNRTGYTLDNKGIVFWHFLNIRQLCCSIKKQLYTACRQFTFDPNSDLL
jgi:hypothetical protein